jgi:protein-disulfide isomerase
MHDLVQRTIAPVWVLVILAVFNFPAWAQKVGTTESVAELNGVQITVDEVDKSIGAPLMKLQEQVYNMRRQKIDALINEKLLANEAQKRGVSVQALLDAEVTSKVGLVTEQEIEDFYQKNKSQIRGELDAVKEQIRGTVQNQKLAGQRNAFIQSLRSQSNVVINLKAPPVFRAKVTTDGAPFEGAEKAPVTIVKFEDFFCPFCKRVQSTFKDLLARYDGKVKVVHRDYPIEQLHPGSSKAHLAARCANEQGKFWAYHDKVYENSPKGNPEQLKAYAKDVGLDVTAFEQCFNSGKYQAAMQKDIEEGTRNGVTGTPAFFINGRMVSGAQPLESFARIIDDELARANRN